MTKQTVLVGVVFIALIAVGGVCLHAEKAPVPQPSARYSPPIQSQSSTLLRLAASPSSTPTSSPTIATPVAVPAFVIANTSTIEKITVQIPDPTLIPGSVNLVLIGATGTQPTILGVMHDDGLKGDAVAGDHVYTLQMPFNEGSAGQIQLEVSAALRGQLKRATSQIVQVAVWSVLSDAVSGFSALYPPTLYSLTSSNEPSGTFFLESSPHGVDFGGQGPENSSNATTSGFGVLITPAQYEGSFDINSWLAAAAPGSDVDTLTMVSVGGQPGYEITFKNQVGAGRPTAVVYHNGYVYQLSYASTFALGSSLDNQGLSAFNSVLQSFSFLR